MLAVQDGAVYSAGLEDEAFLALLANEAAEKRCFDAKPLYRACFAHGLPPKTSLSTQSWPPTC